VILVILKLALIASYVAKVISYLIMDVHLVRTNAQLVLHQMNALSVKRGFSVLYVVKNAPHDARKMFVT
jgi:hypothetical protein